MDFCEKGYSDLEKLRKKFTKQQIMAHYYSDEELKAFMRVSAKNTLKWLEEARRFFNKVASRNDNKLKEQMVLEGW